MTMIDRPNDLLLLAGKVLTVFMQIMLAIAAVALLIGIPVLFLAQGQIDAEIAKEFGQGVDPFPLLTVAGLLSLVLGAVVLVFFFFGKLRAIIRTVGEGDPFVPENADRLNLMAWILLAVQLLLIPAAGLGLTLAKWAEDFDHTDITIDAGLDLTGILMVIVLFILARVFKHGAAMREDLDGTV